MTTGENGQEISTINTVLPLTGKNTPCSGDGVKYGEDATVPMIKIIGIMEGEE
jgi:hypothetical protein